VDDTPDDLVTQLRARVALLEAQLGRHREGLPDRDEVLRRAFEDAPIGMALVGLDERIVEANAALCHMLRYARDELVRRTVPEITHPDDLTVEAKPKDEMRAGASLAFVIEKRYVRSDGTVLLGRLSVSALLDEHGMPAYYLGQLEDVTREREAERALREREAELARALRLDSLGRLAGGVAHDFNNLLTVILGTAESLAEGLVLDDPLLADVDLIRETALRARDLTRQLLAVGRQHQGAPTEVSVRRVVRASERLLARVLGEDVALAIDVADDVGHVLIDPTQLEQVLLNLATNARDAMPAGGRFTLRVRAVTLTAPPPPLPAGRFIELCAEDSGVGMDDAVREQIFDPFFTTKRVGRGTGLGLATVYGIVQLAGGDIRVESQTGHGSRFTVLLPESEAPADDRPSTPDPVAPGAGVALLVEDDASVRGVVARILRRGGYRVLAPAGPEEALALARSGCEIDVIVTDVVMPGLNGADLYARIEQARGPRPVVFMSGYAKANPALLSAHGGFVSKPFTPDTLLAAVRTQIQRCASVSR
jgi:PAS domain S-box-containing protein